jgi:hypothetical protein
VTVTIPIAKLANFIVVCEGSSMKFTWMTFELRLTGVYPASFPGEITRVACPMDIAASPLKAGIVSKSERTRPPSFAKFLTGTFEGGDLPESRPNSTNEAYRDPVVVHGLSPLSMGIDPKVAAFSQTICMLADIFGIGRNGLRILTQGNVYGLSDLRKSGR